MFKSIKERKKLKNQEEQHLIDENISNFTKRIDEYESDLIHVQNPLTKDLLKTEIQKLKEFREAFQSAKKEPN
ncbi:hypothetical protein [Bacillus thuringiensis]|uniref:hypothetical protein n=1 Tax=Bacillus thuringiensis TaxID=1428 RepID=UPI002AB3F959|nr:hypothetical protein [Bacillus thuringiensis]MDY8166482.1 hypothetical protein [Bacillus thuringiensis]